LIQEKVVSYVREACQAPGNALGPSFYDQHLLVVAGLADRLAGMLGADKEVVSLASYLHDISAVLDIQTLPEHHVVSAAIAGTFLEENRVEGPKIERVRQCILKHTAPLAPGAGSPEETSLSHADALSFILQPPYWFYFAFVVRKMTFRDGHDWFFQRVQSNWNALCPEARRLGEEGHARCFELLSRPSAILQFS